MLVAEGGADLVDSEAEEVGGAGHVTELEEGPFPGVGLAFDDGEGADALHGKDVEDEEAEADEGGEDGGAVGATVFAEALAEGGEVFFVFGFDGVDDGHGADEDFTGGEGADEADADFPVVTEGGDGGFDEFAGLTCEGVFKGEGGVSGIGLGVGGGEPDEDGEAEDDGAGAGEEEAGALPDLDEDGTERRPFVGGHLEDHGGGGVAHEGAREEPGEEEGAGDAEAVEGEEEEGFGGGRDLVVRDEGGDEEEVDGEAGGAGGEWGDEDGDESVLWRVDGAGGHDAGDGAGVGAEDGEEGLAIEAGPAHDAVPDEGEAGHVTGVFHEPDEEKEDHDLREEDDDACDTGDDAVGDEVVEVARGEDADDLSGEPGEGVFNEAHGAFGEAEDGPEDEAENEEHDDATPDWM